MPRWFTYPQAVTYTSINPARRRVTSLIGWNALLLRHATNPAVKLAGSSIQPIDECSSILDRNVTYKIFM